MNKMITLFFFVIANSIIGIAYATEAEVKQIVIDCSGTLEQFSSYSSQSVTAKHKIILDIVKTDKNDPGHATTNGIIEFPGGFEVVYNIDVEIGQAGLFVNDKETIVKILARLQRHRGGNGKIVLGASSLQLNQKADKHKSSISMEIVNVQALDTLVNRKSFALAQDPILYKSTFKNAVYYGTLTEGVVKGALLECSTL